MWGLFGRFLFAAVIAAGGMAAGVGWEHRPRQDGLIAKVTGQGLAIQLQDARDELAGTKSTLDGWKDRATACEGRERRQAGVASDQVDTDSRAGDARASAAYNNGYRVGRVAGARTCEARDAPAQAVADPGPGSAGQLRDLSEDFGAGAYVPAAR